MTARPPADPNAAADERRLLESAWAAFEEAVAEDRPLPHLLQEAAERDRVLLQNWNAESASVRIGDVDLELEPGQSVVLWLRPNRPVPPPVGDHQEPREVLAILAEGAPLIG